MDPVGLPLLGPPVVPPGPPADGHRHVGLLDPGLHLFEELVAQRVQRTQCLGGVGVLCLEIGDDLGVNGNPQPEPRVLSIVAVGRQDVGALGGNGRGGMT